jgi:hypothetical protein
MENRSCPYHLGEIVALRRILGIWPPEGGEPYDF